MPIYEYVCQSCQNQFEVKQGLNDAPLTSCTKCDGPVTKIISAPAIMFKGSGWYVTDYSDKLKPPGKSEAGDKSESDKQPASTEKKETTASTSTSEGSSSSSTSTTSSGSPASSSTSASSAASPSKSSSSTSS